MFVAVLFVLCGLSAPVVAVAHGFTHHEQRHHEADLHAVPPGADAGQRAPGALLDVPSHEHAHAHPRLDESSRPRVEVAIAGPPRVREALPTSVVSFVPLVPPAIVAAPPGDPHTGPPPRLRAPPLG